MNRTPFLTLAAAILAFAPVLRSQCVDPPAPPCGFAIQEDLNLLVPWSDLYVVRMDVRYPTAAPGPCGWPLVVCVHGSGGDKSVVAGTAQNLSRAGYITCAYDVRGQGPSSGMNPPPRQHSIDGLREIFDLFEAMERVEMIYPALTDSGRIGVTGYSQGGHHGWIAAQHSGRVPPPNPWRVAPFPAVSAVVIKDAGAGDLSGSPTTAFSANQVEKLFGAGGVVYEPAGAALVQAAIAAGNFAAYDALTTAPGTDPAVLLPLVTTPVYAHASYDDKRVNPSGVVSSWSQVPTATPKRLQLGTSGHDSPENDRDGEVFGENRQKWFNRFLKGIMNGVDQGPAITALVTPDDVPAYLDAASLWDVRNLSALPAPATVNQTLFLAPGGNLLGAPPGFGGGTPVFHNVPPALNMAAWTAWLPTAGQLAAAIPPMAIAYDTAPVTQDRHIQGAATATLAVNAGGSPDWQLHAVLFDVGPGGSARWIASGAETVRGVPGQSVVTIRTYVQSYVLRQGHSLRLQIENLHIHRPPTGSAPEIKSVPVLASSVVTILEGAPVLSTLDVPFLPLPGPRLVTNHDRQSVLAMDNQRMTIHTDSSRAAMPYLIAASFSGTSPGTPAGGIVIPLNIDALTLFILANPNVPPFVNLAGNLNGIGLATGGFQLAGLAFPPAFVGLECSIAAVVVTPAGLEATNAVSFTFGPC